MNNFDNLINEIIQEAKSEAENILNKAQTEANNKIQTAKTEIESNIEAQKTEISILCESIVSKSEGSARLDKSKEILNKKQEILNNIFERVTDNLCNLEQEKYDKLIENLLIKYSQNEDGVALSADTKVNEEFIKSLPVFKERNLKFLYHKCPIRGGFVLSNQNCDTIVSFESMVDEIKEKSILEIAKKLFD